jgi:hypothetical protein
MLNLDIIIFKRLNSRGEGNPVPECYYASPACFLCGHIYVAPFTWDKSLQHKIQNMIFFLHKMMIWGEDKLWFEHLSLCY